MDEATSSWHVGLDVRPTPVPLVVVRCGSGSLRFIKCPGGRMWPVFLLGSAGLGFWFSPSRRISGLITLVSEFLVELVLDPGSGLFADG